MIMRWLCYFVFLLILSNNQIIAQRTKTAQSTPYDIFYLAVGNSHYQKPKTSWQNTSPVIVEGFSDIRGASKSAKQVASHLSGIGAVAGITLVSEGEKTVTREDVFTALGKLLQVAQKAKSRNPLIIFYFCGHGISEGIGWNHFSIPGNFTLPGKEVNPLSLAETTIYAGDIADTIDKQDLPFMLLLDSCYEGKEVPLANRILSEQLERNMTNIFRVLRYVNEYHKPDVAIYAARPGTQAQIVEDPRDPDSVIGVGRIARRLMLILGAASKTKKALSLADFLRQMSDAGFDKATEAVTTLSIPQNPNVNLIKQVKPLKQPRNVIIGTGLLQGEVDNGIRKKKASASVKKRRVAITGYLTFESDLGEFIGQGKNFTTSTENYRFSLPQANHNQVNVLIENNELSWEISFAPPKGKRLIAGLYPDAQRAEFQDNFHSGFSLSGDGRGCNEVQAQFEILEIGWDTNGELVKFRANFSQRCDGATENLQGKIMISAEDQ